MSGTLWSVRLPSRIVPICVSDPIGSPIPRLVQLDAGDERARDRAHADGQHAEAALDGLHHGGLERRAIGGRSWGQRRRRGQNQVLHQGARGQRKSASARITAPALCSST